MKLFSLRAAVSNPLAKNSSIMFVGTMATNFGAYLYHLIVGRILGPEKYSEFAALFSLLFLLSVPSSVIQLVLTKYFSVYRATHELGQARTLVIKSLFGVSVFCFFGFFIYYYSIGFLQKLLHISEFDSFIYLYLIVISTFIITCCTGLLMGFQKFFSSSAISTALVFSRLLSGILLAPFGVALALFGNVLANILSFVFYYISMRFVLVVPSKSIEIKRKDILLFSIPTLLSTLGITALFNLDVVLVKHFFSAVDAGLYASLTVFGKIIFFASSPIILVVFPMIVERREQKRTYSSLFWIGLTLVVLFSFGIVSLYAIFSQTVTSLLFGERFILAAPYLGRFGLFIAFVTISNYLMTVCLAVNKMFAGVIVVFGAIVEAGVIISFHSNLPELIAGMTIVAGIMSSVLLIYYVHESRTS